MVVVAGLHGAFAAVGHQNRSRWWSQPPLLSPEPAEPWSLHEEEKWKLHFSQAMTTTPLTAGNGAIITRICLRLMPPLFVDFGVAAFNSSPTVVPVLVRIQPFVIYSSLCLRCSHSCGVHNASVAMAAMSDIERMKGSVGYGFYEKVFKRTSDFIGKGSFSEGIDSCLGRIDSHDSRLKENVIMGLQRRFFRCPNRFINAQRARDLF
ncbi:hypothetical protein PIB30_072500 [Stylosanthes scabra]|uniref:Uncharacterized protein n=1 Tax=Stylosanthes scabra TaxID=79078 RepID=A0ABU6YPM4_9FABA|nr:hypothetical protein [Stylosanthes scabra]